MIPQRKLARGVLLRYINWVLRNQYTFTVIRAIFLILVGGVICAQQNHTVPVDHFATYPKVDYGEGMEVAQVKAVNT